MTTHLSQACDSILRPHYKFTAEKREQTIRLARFFSVVTLTPLSWIGSWNEAALVSRLIDYDGLRLCLRTAATNGPTVHPPGDTWAWRAMVMMMMLAGENSWFVHQSSQAVRPAQTSVASRRNGRRNENFAYQYLKYLKGSLTCTKILRDGTSGFTSHPKDGVLRIFIALKNPWPRPGLNPRPLGPVASALTTTPPRRPVSRYYGQKKLQTHNQPPFLFHKQVLPPMVILVCENSCVVPIFTRTDNFKARARCQG
jgi:hypothetical protein